MESLGTLASHEAYWKQALENAENLKQKATFVGNFCPSNYVKILGYSPHITLKSLEDVSECIGLLSLRKAFPKKFCHIQSHDKAVVMTKVRSIYYHQCEAQPEVVQKSGLVSLGWYDHNNGQLKTSAEFAVYLVSTDIAMELGFLKRIKKAS